MYSVCSGWCWNLFLQQSHSFMLLSRIGTFIRRAKFVGQQYDGIGRICANWTLFCWKTCKTVENFDFFFENMLFTLFYLERHVVESKNSFWELIFIIMPTRVSRRFLLIGPLLTRKLLFMTLGVANYTRGGWPGVAGYMLVFFIYYPFFELWNCRNQVLSQSWLHNLGYCQIQVIQHTCSLRFSNIWLTTLLKWSSFENSSFSFSI